MELEQELDRLRAEIQAWKREHPGAHFKHELKGRMVVATKRALAKGGSATEVADIFGIEGGHLNPLGQRRRARRQT